MGVLLNMKKHKKLYITLILNTIIFTILSLTYSIILYNTKGKEINIILMAVIFATIISSIIFYIINIMAIKNYTHKVTALKENEYNELIDNLKNESKTNNHLVFSSYHEFLSCITYIMGFTKINKMTTSKLIEKLNNLQDVSMIKEEFEVMNKNFDIVVEEVNSLNNIIENIVELTNIEIQLEKFNMKKSDIKEIINRVILSSYGLLEEKELEIVDDIGDDIKEIEVDEEKISKVIEILLYKVIENTQSGNLYCTVKQEEKDIIISLGDWKICGENNMDIDLRLCKSIVENHKGKLWIKNIEGRGDTVFLSLPICSR
ncbi:hypothetical protein SAMN05444401_2778 [Clostridium amylolyticum]|uniref:Signal transduction histidine kinase n=2 Tax=Clostridium amylolyticum TaxID=1121298 RepID=A0A1M6IEI0_9CLOT|nr:hypothetical protein SAMN05444401_2778 [Clostridium amylolyticum]